MFSRGLIAATNVIDSELITNFINSVLSGYYVTVNRHGIVGTEKKEKIDIYYISHVKKSDKSYKITCHKTEFDVYNKKCNIGQKIEIPIIINRKQVTHLFLQNLWNYMTLKNLRYITTNGYNFLGIKTKKEFGFGDTPFFIVNKNSYNKIFNMFNIISSHNITDYNESFQNSINNIVDFKINIDIGTFLNIIYFIGKFGEENLESANEIYNGFINFLSTENLIHNVLNLRNILSSSITYAYFISILGNMYQDLSNIVKDISFNSLARIFLLSKINNVSGYDRLIEQSGYEFQ